MFKGGGVQECVKAQYTELTRLGHTVKILTPEPLRFKGEIPKDMIFVGVGADIKTPFHTTAQISGTVRTEFVKEMLAKESFDILHFHEPWISVVSRQILANSNAKNIATFHAKLPETLMSKTLEKVAMPYMRSILKYLDAMTAVSEPAASYIKSLTRKQIHIIPNGIALEEFNKLKHTTPKQKNVLYIGRLEKRKGVNYLIEAFHRLKLPNIELIIAGDGPDREKLALQVQNKKLDNIKLLGYVSDIKKKQLLAEATVFCSPAIFGESFGIVLLEAMAAGVPIVAGNNPGYSSVMTGRGKLSLVDPSDAQAFADRLELFLEDDEVRRAWLDWANKTVINYDYPEVIKSYEQLYQQVMQS